MNTNLNSSIPAATSLWSERWAALLGLIGSALLILRKFLTPKAAKLEPLSRAEFYAEMLALKDHLHADHLSLLEKLDTNHRELLAALERQANRINALEAGFARVDERTRE